MIELKPCPFCGAQAAMSVLEDDQEPWQSAPDILCAWIACTCGAQIGECRTEAEAATHWNRRVAAVVGGSGT